MRCLYSSVFTLRPRTERKGNTNQYSILRKKSTARRKIDSTADGIINSKRRTKRTALSLVLANKSLAIVPVVRPRLVIPTG